MRLLILFAFCLLTAATCKENGTNVAKNSDIYHTKDVLYIDVKGKHYKTFSEIPDSLRTPDEKVYAKALKAIMEHGAVVENNVLVLKSDKQVYLDKGMTADAYKQLRKNLNEYNRYLDSIGNDRVAAMIEDMKRGYKPEQSNE